MRSHGGKSGAGRGSGRGMKTRKRVGRRPGCGAENFSAGRGRSAVARKTSRQVGRGSGVSAVREPRLPRGKSVGGAPAFRPQVGRCFCGGRKTSRQVGRGSGVSGYGDHVCRAENLSVGLRHSGRSANDTAAGRTLFRRHGKYGGNRHRPGCGKPVGGAPALSEAPVAPPPSGDGSYSASVKAMPCSASSE